MTSYLQVILFILHHIYKSRFPVINRSGLTQIISIRMIYDLACKGCDTSGLPCDSEGVFDRALWCVVNSLPVLHSS